MLKLLKYARWLDWLLFVLLIGAVVGQVYCDVTIPDYMQRLIEMLTSYSATPTYSDVFRESMYMLAYGAGSLGCSIVVGYIATFISTHLASTVRRNVFYTVTEFSFEDTVRFSTPSLITRTTNDVIQVQMTALMFLRMAISAPITAVWAILKIRAESNIMMVAIGACVALLLISITLLIVLVMKKFSLIQKLTDKMNGVARENLTGLRVVKAFNAEQLMEQKFSEVNTDMSKAHIFANRVMGVAMPLMLLFMNGLTLTIYWLGASLIKSGGYSLPTLLKTTQLAMQVLFAFMMLTMLFVMLPRGEISAKRILDVLKTKPKISDPAKDKPFVEEGTVEFKDVSFKYPEAESYVLKDISFRANKGDTVAIIGSTGSGKSTLINLVPRFYDATMGEVLVCGTDVKHVKQASLRSKIGYVPQKGVLFSGTVEQNITYGAEGLAREHVVSAAATACAEDFVNEMEDGFDSYISQGGKNVSGGQKQRLSIARAVAARPEILIFDDSFSALDYKTDREVRTRLKQATADTTCLIVAARVGTVMDADRIIVLDAGCMVGMGTHAELLKTCEVYREIALSQLSKEELGI